MDNRIFELEDLIGKELESEIQDKSYWFWGERIIGNVLNSLIGDQNVTPYTIRQTQYGATEEYVVKAKGTSTELIDVKCNMIKEDGYRPTGVASVEVTIISKIIEDLDTLVDYLKDRVKRLEQQLDKKADKFTTLLNDNNLDMAEYLKIMDTFNRLDAATRTYLSKKAKPNP